MKIASWNVNSLKVRLPHLQQWLAEAQPDIVALQETKLTDDKFPVDEIAAMGYQVAYSGQKTYNGVAILAKGELRDVVTDIEGLDDPQRRILAATVGDIRVVNLYVVNGKALGDEKYTYKLHWLAISSKASARATTSWWCWATSTSAATTATCTTRSRGARTSSARRPSAPRCRRCSMSVFMTVSVFSPKMPAFSAGGTIVRPPSAATWGCGSTSS